MFVSHYITCSCAGGERSRLFLRPSRENVLSGAQWLTNNHNGARGARSEESD